MVERIRGLLKYNYVPDANGGMDIGAMFRDAAINMFSRIKPVRLHSENPYYPTNDDGTTNPHYMADWYKTDGYGIKIPTLTQLTKSEFETKKWTYAPPLGNGDSGGYPMRLNDFIVDITGGGATYNHNAPPCIHSGNIGAVRWNRLLSDSITVRAYLGVGTSTSIGFDDLAGDIGRSYISLSMGDEPSETQCKSATEPIERGGITIELLRSETLHIPSGRTYLWFFISGAQKKWGVGDFTAMKPVYSGQGWLNPVPIDIFEQSPIKAVPVAMKDAVGIWRNFADPRPILLPNQGQSLVKIVATNTDSSFSNLDTWNMSMETIGFNFEPYRGSQFFEDEAMTQRVGVISLAPNASTTMYCLGSFVDIAHGKPLPSPISLGSCRVLLTGVREPIEIGRAEKFTIN